MSDKLINADNMLKYTVLAGEIKNPYMEVVPAYFVREAPAVDAIEVVRCSQCLYSTEEIWSTTKRYGERGTVKCCNPNSIAFNRLCLPRDFCRVGERRDENSNG